MKSMKDRLAEIAAERRRAPAQSSSGKRQMSLLLAAGVVCVLLGLQFFGRGEPDSNSHTEAGGSPAASVTTAAVESPTTPTAQPTKPVLGAEADALQSQFKELAAPCDDASVAAEVVMTEPGITADLIYSAAKTALDACRTSWLDIGNKLHPPPSADGTVKEGFSAAIETCQLAYFGKKHAFQSITEALDHEMRPSMLAEARNYSLAAKAKLGQCIDDMQTKVRQAGNRPPS